MAAHANASVATAVSINSTPANGADYRAGESIIVRVVFDQPVYSYGIGAGFVPRRAPGRGPQQRHGGLYLHGDQLPL